jgi:1-acyl-sn-glycerol-3-phosphate acyltransferase
MYSALIAAGRAGNRPLLHRLERAWGRQAATAARIRIELIGLDSIDPDRSYVVAPLHEGFADALALLRLPLDLVYAARDELFTWRYLGGYLRSAGHVLVPTRDGASGYRSLLRAAPTVFARGESLAVFPQGTILGIESAFSAGAFRLAQRFDRPLLPVVITGSHLVWEHPYDPALHLGRTIRLEVLPPVPGDEAVARAAELEQEMKQRALAVVGAPARRFEPDRDGWWDDYPYEIDPSFEDLHQRLAEHRA